MSNSRAKGLILKKFYVLLAACVNASLAPVKFETPGSLHNTDIQAKRKKERPSNQLKMV